MATTKPGPAEALLALLVEVTGVVIVVTIAGINDKTATLMLIFAIGLWMLFLITHTHEVTRFSNVLSGIEGSAKKA
jgi:hypothetical protein